MSLFFIFFFRVFLLITGRFIVVKNILGGYMMYGGGNMKMEVVSRGGGGQIRITVVVVGDGLLLNNFRKEK